jgi:hypothetical protein
MVFVMLLSLTVVLTPLVEPPTPWQAEILARLREARHPQTITVLVEGSPERTYPVRHPILGPHGDEGWFYCREAYVPAGEGVWLNHREEYPALAGFQILRVTDASRITDPGPNAAYSVLLNPHVEAFVLCEDEDIAVFSAELRRARVRIRDLGPALEIAETFLSLLGAEYHNFMLARPGPPPDDPWHIGGQTSHRKLLTETTPSAHAPAAERRGSEFVAVLYTRSIYRRDVSRVEIRMTPDAHMTLRREFIETMDTTGWGP